MTWLPALICTLLIGGSLGRVMVFGPDASELSKKAPVQYVITGQKDADGHWTEQVNMEHGEEDWHMEIDHMTLDVGGQPKVKITATFSAKSKITDVAEIPEDRSEPAESGGDVPGTVFELFPRSYMDWFGAQRHCKEWGGHLAIPDTREKMRQLKAILRKHVHDIGEPTGAFLGFDDLEREGHFVTVLGKPLFNSQDSTWSPHWFQAGQPDDDKSWTTEGEDCGSLRPNGGINDVPCRYNLPFICEKSAAAEPVEMAVDEEDTSTSVADIEDEDEDEDEDTLRLIQFPRLDWFQARLACVEWGGHLAIPDSEAKMLKMHKMLKAPTTIDQPVSAFVGVNDIREEGQFVTIFDTPVFNNSASWTPRWFNSNQPDDDKSWTAAGEDCGAVRPEGGLNDVPCTYLLPFFCEKSAQVDDVEAPTHGDDASNERDTLTLFTRDDLDWADANQACEEWGGHLAIPDSAGKMEVMTLKMKLAEVRAAFLGFNDQEQEGHFVTIFGKPVFNEGSWSPHWSSDSQPDDDKDWFPGGEDCGSVNWSGGLNDVPCKHHMPFFCEKPFASDTSDEAAQVNDGHVSPLPSNFHKIVDFEGSAEIPSSLEQLLSHITVDNSNPEESSPSTEEDLSQVITLVEDLPTVSDSPTSAQRNVEDEESSSSTEEALMPVITSMHDLDTPSDSPVGAHMSEVNESSSMEEALLQVINTIQNLPTHEEHPITIQM